MSCCRPYHEVHRPQFHFTPRKNWTNDPNGLVYYKGEYHLFFQYNEKGIQWGPNTWGHAVSPDLVHWRQINHAIRPDDYGWIWSGSAVIDGNNTAGFKRGQEDVLVAIYTTGGWGTPPNPTVQSIAYSNDRGRTWTKYKGNPVLGHVRGDNRDPKVMWHAPTKKWIMALYLDAHDFALFASTDLKTWGKLCDVVVPDTSECPDFFPLPVDGDPAKTKWVFWGGGSIYLIGSFDGTTFRPEQEACRCELGANGYAAQTWSDTPDGRRIQTSWMAGGKYPAMPFNQQMSFPVELSLRRFPEGLRLCRQPVREIQFLHDTGHNWRDLSVPPGQNLLVPTRHDLFHIRGQVALDGAKAFGAIIHGIGLHYDLETKKFVYLGRDIPVEPIGGRVEFEVLVDRTSMELFVHGGKVSASFCFLPEPCDTPLEFYSIGGAAQYASLSVHELLPAWD